MEHTAVNGSVHTACKQHQMVCKQICVQICLRVLCERGLATVVIFQLVSPWLKCQDVGYADQRLMCYNKALLLPHNINPDLDPKATLEMN